MIHSDVMWHSVPPKCDGTGIVRVTINPDLKNPETATFEVDCCDGKPLSVAEERLYTVAVDMQTYWTEMGYRVRLGEGGRVTHHPELGCAQLTAPVVKT